MSPDLEIEMGFAICSYKEKRDEMAKQQTIVSEFDSYWEPVGVVCNLVISVDCSLNYSHHKTQHKTLQSRERNGIEHNEH